MKHIAFDLGAESGRAIVGEIINKKLNMKEIHRFVTKGIYVNGHMRWDVYLLFSELKKALSIYADMYGEEPCTMGVDTWGVDYGFLDEEGQLISIPYHYRDKRNLGTGEIIEAKFGLNRLYEETGVQQMEINTLNQLIASREANDISLKAGNKLLFIGDILHYFLCGKASTEYTIASTSNMYSMIKHEWSIEVLKNFSIEENTMAEVKKTGDILGNIHSELAVEVGITKACQIIIPAIHDTASAVVAVPALGKNVAFISSGTWSLVGIELEEAFVNEETKKYNIANYGGAFDKILFIKNVMGLWLIQQSRNQWLKSNSELSYEQIVNLAENAQPFYGVIDANDHMFLNPDNMPIAVCEYLEKTGQKTLNPEDIGQVARIIFESLAFKYRYVFDIMSSVCGKKIDQLNIIGGGIQNQMLTQFAANVMGVKVVAGPIEATAIGNILTQAYGSGEINSINELRQIVLNTSMPMEYTPAKKEIWEERFESYIKICEIY